MERAKEWLGEVYSVVFRDYSLFVKILSVRRTPQPVIALELEYKRTLIWLLLSLRVTITGYPWFPTKRHGVIPES